MVDTAGLVEKEEVVDLLNIANPNNLAGFEDPFHFPFITIEDVLVLDADTIVVLNDNNYDRAGGRPDLKDQNEMIILTLDTPLDVAEGVGTSVQCQ